MAKKKITIEDLARMSQNQSAERRCSGKILTSFLALTLMAALAARAQESAPWQDSSEHRVQFVTVEDGVRLEVLDWGGSGRPVVLLAGYNTAHLFDEFAVKLSETSRVFGITRRGIGASSRPESGYTAQRSADDVLQVLDSLKLVAPVLVGQSWGGQDLNTLGAVAELERSLIAERVRAGLKNARAKGKKLGRPSRKVDARRVARLRAQGASWVAIADELGVGEGTVRRAAQKSAKNPSARDSANH